MKKIIHISDVHSGYKNFEDRFMAVIDHIQSMLAGTVSQYVVVITGDLVHNATVAGSYARVRKSIDYMKRCGFKQVLVVPGNHDYGTGNKGNKKFVALFKNTFYGADIDYPKVDIIDRVAFIGLDSMAEELHWYDELWAQGQLGQKQLRALAAILREEKITTCAKRVIYLHHHPFKWRPLHQLKDSRKLKKVLIGAIAQGVSIDALLFGHNHEGNAHNGTWGIARCYDGGTVTLKSRPRFVKWARWFKVQSSTRIIDLTKPPEADTVIRIDLFEGAKITRRLPSF